MAKAPVKQPGKAPVKQPGKAPVKQPGKALVKWDEEFAKLAKEGTKGMTLASAKFLSIRGGKFSLGGADMGKELDAVIVGWVNENQFYIGDFDPDSPQSPACYAFGIERDEMAPSDDVPEKQNDVCDGCPNKEWESAERGRGKACKDVVRLALIASGDLEDLDAAEIIYLKVPVMSVKNFTFYAKETVANKLNRPYWAVVTKMSVEPDPKSQIKLVFEVEDNIEDSDLFGPLKALWERAMEGIAFPYPKYEVEEKPKRGAKKPPAKAAKFARK